jgi:hypothetical protein
LWVALAVAGAAFCVSTVALRLTPPRRRDGLRKQRRSFEPSAAGKEYFRLPEGIARRRPPCARAVGARFARRDGLRGWMPADSVERIEQRLRR